MPMDDEKDPQDEGLYAAWRKIYPKYQAGFFRNLKWLSLGLFLGLYFLTPLLRWERAVGEPNQAILFDLPGRKFYMFDLVIWPQDIFLLAFLLIVLTIGLFFMTALAGRVFCGYMCFQTVWTDLFIFIEKLTEGDRARRMRLDAGPWTLNKLTRKAIKHLLWISIGLLTGWAFVAYFADAFDITRAFLRGDAPYPAWFTLGFLTLTTYVFAGFAREQVCIYMCPYARFQGVMFDDQTLIVAYDEKRGETRQSNRRLRRAENSGVGDCIDCGECVRVCPMGIDIRDGQQYQCTTCAACIDACDQVMVRIKKPRGLVRYTSLTALQGGVTHMLRFRVVVYGLLLTLGLGAMAGYLILRNPLDLNVIRHRSPLYIMQSDGAVQNNYTVRILNLTKREQSYKLSQTGLDKTILSLTGNDRTDARGQPIVTVGPGEVMPYTLFVRQAPDAGKSGRQEVTFTLTALDPTGGQDHYDSVFMRP